MRTLTLFLAAFSLNAGNLYTVCASGCTGTSLQTVYNSATCGDVIEVASTYSAGTFQRANKSCNPPGIMIRSDQSGQISNAVRDTTVAIDATHMFQMRATGGGSAAMTAACSSDALTIVGADIGAIGQDVFDVVQDICSNNVNGNEISNYIGLLPHDLVIDKSYIHAAIANNGLTNTAIELGSGKTLIQNSLLVGFSVSAEAKGAVSVNSRGPLSFINNEFESSGIGTITGGAVPDISGNRATLSRWIGNYYYRPWSWLVYSGTSNPTGVCPWDMNGGALFNQTTTTHEWSCDSGTWTDHGPGTWPLQTVQDKNHFEWKNGWGGIAHGNYFSNAWYPTEAQQKGAVILINQVDNEAGTGGEAAAVVAYSDFSYNYGQSTPWFENFGVNGSYFYQVHDVSITNNLAVNIGQCPQSCNNNAGKPSTFEAGLLQTQTSGRVTIRNNTLILNTDNSGLRGTMMELDSGTSTQQALLANIMGWNYYGSINTFNSNGNGNGAFYGPGIATPAWDYASSSIWGNVVPNDKSQTFHGVNTPTASWLSWYVDPGNYWNNIPGAPATQSYPVAAKMPASWAAVNLINFQAAGGGDYAITPGTTYSGTGFNGQDPGADTTQNAQYTAGAVSGRRNPYLQMAIHNIAWNVTGGVMRYTAPTPETCTVTVASNAAYTSPAFILTDTGGDTDRNVTFTGLTAATRYFVKVVCGASLYLKTTVGFTKIRTGIVSSAFDMQLGTNYDWFQNTTSPCYDPGIAPGGTPNANQILACVDADYVIANYDVNQSQIDSQLASLRAAGNQSLRIILWHTRGTDLIGQNFYGTNLTGAERCSGSLGTRHWVLDSTGGTLSTQCLANLTNFVLSVREHGFQKMIIAMGPEASNWFYSPGANGGSIVGTWPVPWIGVAPYEGYYQENWSILQQIQAIASGASTTGFKVFVDPHTECINGGVAPSVSYCGRIWTAYAGAFGLNGTYGFSLLPDQAASLAAVYGSLRPHYMDLHLYPYLSPGVPDGSQSGANSNYQTQYSAVVAAGFGAPVVVSETWCCNQATYTGQWAAQSTTVSSLIGIYDWPLQISGLYSNPQLTVPTPASPTMTVTWQSGDKFDGLTAGEDIILQGSGCPGNLCAILSVTDSTHLVLASPSSPVTNAVYQASQ